MRPPSRRSRRPTRRSTRACIWPPTAIRRRRPSARVGPRVEHAALVTFLEQLRVGHFVYVSSGAVYDGLIGPVTPATPVAPRLPYAISKLASEHYLRFFAERRDTVDSYINVRFFGAYGPYEPARKITTRWLRGVMAGQREFTLRGNGENLIDFMYVDDAVDGFLRLTRARLQRHRRLRVGHAGQRQRTSCRRWRGCSASTSRCGTRATPRSTSSFISVDRTMRERFGFAPTISFDDGVRRLHEFLVRARWPARVT